MSPDKKRLISEFNFKIEIKKFIIKFLQRYLLWVSWQRVRSKLKMLPEWKLIPDYKQIDFVQLFYCMQLKNDFLSRAIKTQKMFNFVEGHCSYANIELEKKNEKFCQDSEIRINNVKCEQNGERLIKTTEIRFRNIAIYIEDCYRFAKNVENQQRHKSSSNPTTSSDGSQNNNESEERRQNHHGNGLKKRKMIFKKKFLVDHHTNEKRNTKNIAKNFCKAFLSYLQQKKENATFSKTKTFIVQNNYNNRAIQKMATDESINPFFKQFLEKKAQKWIQTSKIHNKQIHLEAIKLYLQLIEQGEGQIEDSQELYKEEEQKSIYHSDDPYDSSDRDSCHDGSLK